MLLKHIRKFEQGKQGVTGLVEIQDGTRYVYKISQFMNYIVEHEYRIIQSLEGCPHFVRSVGFHPCRIHPQFRKLEQDPFAADPQAVVLDVLFLEYLEDTKSLADLLDHAESATMMQILSVIKQTLAGVLFGQIQARFAHYDLHAQNVLVRECPVDDVHLYILGPGRAFCIPSLGFRPTIIDFGFAYSSGLDGRPLCISMCYDDTGYMSPGYDPVADPKLFLVSLLDDFRHSDRESHRHEQRFRKLVGNIFGSLDIDWESGWDVKTQPAIMDRLFQYMENLDEPSHLLSEFPHYCMDILQHLVNLPLRPNPGCTLRGLRTAYRAFATEFLKLEISVHNMFYSLYLLRRIVDLTISLRDAYRNPKTQARAVSEFRKHVCEFLDQHIQFCKTDQVQFEILLCSLISFGEELGARLYHALEKRMREKTREYSGMRVRNLEAIIFLLDYHFPTRIQFGEETRVHVCRLDAPPESIRLSDELVELLNSSPVIQRAAILCAALDQSKPDSSLP